MYTLIVVAVVVVALVVALTWRGRAAAAPPTRAGSPRTPRADLTGDAERVDPEEAG